jgi:hypothetical protein
MIILHYSFILPHVQFREVAELVTCHLKKATMITCSKRQKVVG